MTGEHALPASVEDIPILGDTISAVVSGKMSPIPGSFVCAASNTIQSDNRSLFERFRTAPKKALSVTDLVSPAWYAILLHPEHPQLKDPHGCYEKGLRYAQGARGPDIHDYAGRYYIQRGGIRITHLECHSGAENALQDRADA